MLQQNYGIRTRAKRALQAFHKFLEVMDIDYIDQFLIRGHALPNQYVETYQAMEEILKVESSNHWCLQL